jgi:TorA maturation chaperone TorD
MNCHQEERAAMIETDHEPSFDPAVRLARQLLYRFSALTLLDPKADSWEQLDALCENTLISEAAVFIRDLPNATPKELGLGERPPTALDPSLVLARLPASRNQLNEEYESTFGLLVSNACPPYETEYIDSKYAFQRSNALADINGFYHAFGLTTSTERHERPDHIVQMLEFMAVLIGLERHATAGNAEVNRQRQELCRDAQSRFLREHLAWWAPAFARLLSHENPGGFYDAAGRFLSAIIPVERALLGVETPKHRAEPSQLERPEECEGCQLVN